MWPYDSTDPNALLKQTTRGERPRVLDTCAGDASIDGYTRISRADRETGVRSPVDAVRAWPRRPLE